MALTTVPSWRSSARPNQWDLLAFPLVIGLIALLAWGSRQMSVSYTPGQQLPISLNPLYLPEYALRTVLRMALALVASLIFTFTYATAAAKSARAEKVLIPVLDILQSVPILGFLSITVVGFMALFRGNLFGVELAASFAIFTSQAWNMAFSFYQSLKTVPGDLRDAATMLRLSPWKRFWTLEVPFGAPSLIWNTMMSVSGGWFFVVASEAISVGKTQVALPGIGSYVAVAINQQNLHAIGWALLAMFVVILTYDQLLFRPLVAWAEKFKLGDTALQYTAHSFVLDIFQRAHVFRLLAELPGRVQAGLSREQGPRPRRARRQRTASGIRAGRLLALIAAALLGVLAASGLVQLVRFVVGTESPAEVAHVFVLGAFTMIRVVVLILIASMIWVPIGVYVGLNARLAVRAQPVAQFLAAFPANLFFPVAVILLVKFRLSPEIWTAPLMILGTQWYILFNVIAGAAAIPNDLRDASANFHMPRLQRWRRLYLPAVFPYLATGLITASGGTWNASIVAEVVSWGPHTLTATGLGSYIANATVNANYGQIVLGIIVMSVYVVTLNRVLWRRLFRLAESRYRLD